MFELPVRPCVRQRADVTTHRASTGAMAVREALITPESPARLATRAAWAQDRSHRRQARRTGAAA
ncbi:MAG: hypothetical protein ACLTSX_01840 [Collinsella sp.]